MRDQDLKESHFVVNDCWLSRISNIYSWNIIYS